MISVADPGRYPGSEFFPSRIQDKKDYGSRILIRIKEFKYFLPKKFILSSRKYDCVHPRSGSRIRILIFTHPSGVKKALDPGSGSAVLVMMCSSARDNVCCIAHGDILCYTETGGHRKLHSEQGHIVLHRSQGRCIHHRTKIRATSLASQNS
jgi:hypothetical protein